MKYNMKYGDWQKAMWFATVAEQFRSHEVGYKVHAMLSHENPQHSHTVALCSFKPTLLGPGWGVAKESLDYETEVVDVGLAAVRDNFEEETKLTAHNMCPTCNATAEYIMMEGNFKWGWKDGMYESAEQLRKEWKEMLPNADYPDWMEALK